MFEFTFLEWKIDSFFYQRAFVFFGTLSAYNFVKYVPLLQSDWKSKSVNFRIILLLSLLSLILATYFFTQFILKEQLVILCAIILLVLYTVPLTTSIENLRNIGGFKIHIVAACWTLITLILPLVDSKTTNSFFWLSALQRYFWVFLAILPFEIGDSISDSENLGTLPQQLGISKTKWLGYFLFGLIIICSLFSSFSVFLSYLVMMVLYVFFLITSSADQSQYRNVFWVEAVPFIGWLVLYLQY